MYNRYIGNTGKYYRVDDDHYSDTRTDPQSPLQSTDISSTVSVSGTPEKQGSTYPIMQNNPIGSIKRLIGNFMPKGAEIGDLLLILVLLLLYLEKEDEEILIILSVLIFNGFM